MCDDGFYVDTSVKEVGHLVPGLVHLAAVDAFDGDHVEDDGFPVDGELLAGDAEKGDVSAVKHVGKHVLEGGGDAGHFHADVKTFLHAELSLNVLDRSFTDVDRLGDVAHLFGKFEAEGVDVGDHDIAGTSVFRDRSGHDTDRAGTGDQDVFAEDFKFKGGMDRVAERVEDRGDVEVDARLVLPNVGVWNGNELGEPAVGVYADAARVGT